MKALTVVGAALAAGVFVHATSASAQEIPDQPKITLDGYYGSLCPEGSLELDARTGALNATLSRDLNNFNEDPTSDGDCHIDLVIEVAEGWTFDRPRFVGSLFSLSTSPASHVEFKYTWPTYAGGTRSETFNRPIASSDRGVSDVIEHFPNIVAPTCGPSQSFVLGIDIKADIQPETALKINALDADFTDSEGHTSWHKCPWGVDGN